MATFIIKKVLRPIGIDLIAHKQAYMTYMMATLIEELRSARQQMADYGVLS